MTPTPAEVEALARALCDDEPPCTDCGDTGFSTMMERYCTCGASMELQAAAAMVKENGHE